MRIVTLRYGRYNFDLDHKFEYSDFGLSRNLSEQKGEDLTEYVVTRYYRAPEIMLSSHEYSHKVDVWSAGCTFGEVLSGKIRQKFYV